MGDLQTMRDQLLGLKKAVELGLERLAELEKQAGKVSEERANYDVELPNCLRCGHPIAPGQPSVRGLHKNPCYYQLRRELQTNNETYDDAVADGRMKPVGEVTTGRPRKYVPKKEN